jgi:hypothetical protein
MKKELLNSVIMTLFNDSRKIYLKLILSRIENGAIYLILNGSSTRKQRSKEHKVRISTDRWPLTTVTIRLLKTRHCATEMWILT